MEKNQNFSYPSYPPQNLTQPSNIGIQIPVINHGIFLGKNPTFLNW